MNTFNPQATQTPNGNTAAVCTLPDSGVNARWTLNSVSWSYDAAPTGGSLIIAWTDPIAGALSRTYYISGGGPASFTFPSPLRFPVGATGITITLAAAGGSIKGSVYPDATTAS